jgi:glycosyltransferase involved in cell wall biosynthesis
MRVAIDARPALDARKTGVGYYTANIIRELPRADPDTDFVAWYLHARGLFRPRTFFADPAVPNLHEKASRFPARVFGPVSSRTGVPRLEWLCRTDVVFATNFLPPATHSTKVVMMVHDLAFRLFPETAPHHDGRWLRQFEHRLDTSARLLVPSRSAKEDLTRLYPVDPEKVDAVHHGVDADAFRPVQRATVERTLRRLGIFEPYLLFVGGIEPRKNLSRLVQAFAKLPERTSLVIAGGRVRWFPKASEQLDAEIERLAPEVRSRVVRLGYVSDADKLALLTGADVFVYPSRYEGFGMPVLEAMACGTAVVTSTTSSLPEVAGEAAVLVDPAEPDAIAAGLAELLDDDDLRHRLEAAGLARAAGFTWARAARETAASLRRAGGVEPAE